MKTDSPRLSRRELAAQATREDLLNAGAELALEAFSDGQADPLRLLSPSAIAKRASERAEVSRAMLYHLWPDDEASSETAERLDPYLAALFKQLFEEAFNPGPLLELFEQWAEYVESGARVSLAASMCGLANLQFERHRFHPEGGDADKDALQYRFGTQLAVAGEGLRRRGRLSVDEIEDLRQRTSYSKLVDAYGRALDLAGLELLDAFEIDDLVQMLWAIQDGFTLNSWHFGRLNRTVAPSGGLLAEDWDEVKEYNQEWSLFAVATWSLFRSITRPKRSAENAED